MLYCHKNTAELEAEIAALKTLLHSERLNGTELTNFLCKALHDAERVTKERDQARAQYKQFEHDKNFELEMLQSILKQLTININLKGK